MAALIEAGFAVVRPASLTLDDRVAAALAIDWELPEASRRPRRVLDSGAPAFRVAVSWPTRMGAFGAGTADMAEHVQLARDLEAAGVDFVVIGDGRWVPPVGDGDAGVRSVLLAVPVLLATSTMGVVTTLRTTFTAPMHVARFGANLDWLSDGRWGWCAATGHGDDVARLYGLPAMPDLLTRYAMAADNVRAVEAIWRGGRTGVEYSGSHFRVRGESKRPFPVQQPRPPIFGVGTSTCALTFAARHVDVWMGRVRNADRLRAVAAALRGEAADFGRPAPRVYLEVNLAGDGAMTTPLFDDPMTTFEGDTEQIAALVGELVESRLLEGLLLNLADSTAAQVEMVRRIIDALETSKILEPAPDRAGRW